MRVRAPRFLGTALFCAAQKLGLAPGPVNEASFRFRWGNKARESLDFLGAVQHSCQSRVIPPHNDTMGAFPGSERNPEKWKPVFRKIARQFKKLEPHSDSNKVNAALGEFARMPKPLIIICGSMTHHARMLELRVRLEARGIAAVAPVFELAQRTAAARIRFKRRVSQDYFRLIRRKTVAAILVANFPKESRRNYIGPNVFAEIAIAFDARKPIYLLNGLDSTLRDELVAWEVIPLRGDMEIPFRALKAAKQRT